MLNREKILVRPQMKLLNLGLIHEAQEMGEIASRSAEGVEGMLA